MAARRVVLPGSERVWAIQVAGDLSESRQEVRRFNTTLAWSLGIMGLGLIAAMLIQVRFGLEPLRRISQGLSRIRSGRAERLDDDFPAEITPLAEELNIYWRTTPPCWSGRAPRSATWPMP